MLSRADPRQHEAGQGPDDHTANNVVEGLLGNTLQNDVQPVEVSTSRDHGLKRKLSKQRNRRSEPVAHDPAQYCAKSSPHTASTDDLPSSPSHFILFETKRCANSLRFGATQNGRSWCCLFSTFFR